MILQTQDAACITRRFPFHGDKLNEFLYQI